MLSIKCYQSNPRIHPSCVIAASVVSYVIFKRECSRTLGDLYRSMFVQSPSSWRDGARRLESVGARSTRKAWPYTMIEVPAPLTYSPAPSPDPPEPRAASAKLPPPD